MGEKGPSYRNSLFHSVLRRGGGGEGLVGGDYEGKMGKGGAAIFGSVQGEEEVAKRCERGMVGGEDIFGNTINSVEYFSGP